MNRSNTPAHGRELESAREREFDALLEAEFVGKPPVDAILKRAEHGPLGLPRKPARSWLAAALVMLGIGVAVALAWNARLERDDHNSASPQAPNSTVDVHWPVGVPRIHSFNEMSNVPDDATHLSLGMPVAAARDLSRLANLQHLGVEFTSPSRLAKLIHSGGSAKPGSRLDVLATAPTLRRLSIDALPMAAADLAALRHVKRLQVLELGHLFEINDELKAAMRKGGNFVGHPFDRDLGAAIANHSQAKTLQLSGMPITVEGLRALAGAELHSLILDIPIDVAPEVLEVIGELTTLRRLELRTVHSASLDQSDGIARLGSHSLSVAAMQSIATLPVLRSLTLDRCHLDPDLVAALPRKLLRLDLSSCLGVDGRLVDVIAAMPELRDVGLPLVMARIKDFPSRWLHRFVGSDFHTRRLSADQAATIIGSRVWQALRLEGQLTEAVTDELANQSGLQALTLTPTSGSESLAFVSHLPKLEKVTFVQTDITEPLLKPLNECASLRTVAFEACLRSPNTNEQSNLTAVLRDGIVSRWGFRRVW